MSKIKIKKLSRSQQMRNVLYRIWEKVGIGDFEVYYDDFMRGKIDKLKDYLSDLDK